MKRTSLVIGAIAIVLLISGVSAVMISDNPFDNEVKVAGIPTEQHVQQKQKVESMQISSASEYGEPLEIYVTEPLANKTATIYYGEGLQEVKVAGIPTEQHVQQKQKVESMQISSASEYGEPLEIYVTEPLANKTATIYY